MKKQPEIYDFDEIVFPSIKRIKLNDFTTVYTVPDKSQDICRIQLILNGGDADEHLDHLARITTMMTNQGSEQLNCKEIAELLDYCGTNFSSTTVAFYSIYDLITLTRLTDKIIPILEQIIKYPIFPEVNLETLKTNCIEGLKARMKKNKVLAEITFRNLFYGNRHFLGKIPEIQNISKITRDNVIEFYDTYCRAKNVKVVLSGNINDKLITDIGNIFNSEWHKHGKLPKRNRNILKTSGINEIKIVNTPNAVQSSIIIGMPTINRKHEDYIPLRIATYLLGGYFGSRLMQNIREDKGYTYGIYAQLTSSNKTGVFKINTDCDIKYTYQVIREVNIEMEKLKSKLVPDSELQMVKSSMLSSIAKLIDSPFDIADYIASKKNVVAAKRFFNNQIEGIRNITAEKIRETAKKYFNSERFITVIATDENKLKKIPLEH